MNDQEETNVSGPNPCKQRRIIHFSSGETLEEEDSEEEEEQSSRRPPFREPTEKTRLSFKSVAVLIGRISLMTCDFLGERLAGALGLNAAKYQYAIDQYQHDHKKTRHQPTEGVLGGQAETIHFSRGEDGSHYGATGEADPREQPMERKQGHHNRSYQQDEDCLK